MEYSPCRKLITLFTTLFLCTQIVCAQHSVKAHNINLLDTIKSYYSESCVKIYNKQISKKKKKKDVKVFKDLNIASKLLLDTNIFHILETMGFYKSSEVLDMNNNKIILYNKNAGNVISTIEFHFNLATKNIARKILIATETKFVCEKANRGNLYNNVDFIYLRKVIKAIDFPLKLSNTITTLESID